MENMTMLQKIYKRFADLKDEAKVDLEFDKSNMDSAFNVTICLGKWIIKKTEWQRVCRDFDDKRKKQYRKLYEFYHHDFPVKLNTNAEYTLFIESDEGYSECYNNYIVSKEVIQFIDSIIDTIKSKQWEVKNYMEWLKFKNGQ